MSTNPTGLSHEEIERMRQLVAQHDNQSKIQEFDLNNPPKQPYSYQEFPRLMYHHGKRIHKPANNAEEMQAALDAGWSKDPYPPEWVEPAECELEPEISAEAHEAQEKLDKAKAAAKRKK